MTTQAHAHDAVRMIELVDEPIDVAAIRSTVDDDGAGAVVVFEGVTRTVPMLRFEAYAPMACKLLAEHAHAVAEQLEITGIAVVHRLGDVPLGAASIVIAVSAPHRPAAFDGARQLIDRIKADVPIWKQELTAEGATWGRSEQHLAAATTPSP